MNLPFYKYQATGNDFVLMDNREGKLSLTSEDVIKICDRKFGVGSDGLILIEKDTQSDFKMVYYNADGSQSLCANGCRTAVDLASSLGLINGKAIFSTYDGVHHAELLPDGLIKLQMNDVHEVKLFGDDLFIHTGSPHYIRIVKNLHQYPVVETGRKIRYSEPFEPGGTNVNFVELVDKNVIAVRTYERGVEDETLSCGTGVTAAALAVSRLGYASPIKITVEGGELVVSFKPDELSPHTTFTAISLTGPAKMVFQGNLEL